MAETIVTPPRAETGSAARPLAAAHRRRWLILALIFGAIVLNYIDRQILSILKPTLKAEFGFDDRGYALLVNAFTVGYATMCAAAAGSEVMPLRGLAGFVSPEVALGDVPTAAADVYGVGALMVAMLTGSPTGLVLTTPALERLVRRALDTDLTRRFASAVELREDGARRVVAYRPNPTTGKVEREPAGDWDRPGFTIEEARYLKLKAEMAAWQAEERAAARPAAEPDEDDEQWL